MPESTLSNFINLLIYSLATVMGLVVVIAIVALFIRDITQKQHTLLRNYPVIGRLRYFFEIQGKYFRQYLFSGDRDEMPFNRATRTWIYKSAKIKEVSLDLVLLMTCESLARLYLLTLRSQF